VRALCLSPWIKENRGYRKVRGSRKQGFLKSGFTLRRLKEGQGSLCGCTPEQCSSTYGAAFRNDYSFAEKVAWCTPARPPCVSSKLRKVKPDLQETLAFAGPNFFDILDFSLDPGRQTHWPSPKPDTGNYYQIGWRTGSFGGRIPIDSIIAGHQWDFRVTGILRILPVNKPPGGKFYCCIAT